MVYNIQPVDVWCLESYCGGGSLKSKDMRTISRSQPVDGIWILKVDSGFFHRVPLEKINTRVEGWWDHGSLNVYASTQTCT